MYIVRKYISNIKRGFVKKAFTLAEIMIVLTVIGVIPAILLPGAINSSPDENVMKFKKGNNTLGTVIRELVNSDKYYANGSLSRMPDGDFVNSPTYFCETFADISNTKKINCTDEDEGIDYAHLHLTLVNGVDNTNDMKKYADSYCKNYQKEEITLSDGIIYYEVSPYHHFGNVAEKFKRGKRSIRCLPFSPDVVPAPVLLRRCSGLGTLGLAASWRLLPRLGISSARSFN